VRDGRADEVGRENQDRIVVKFRRQPFLRQLDSVAFDPREADLESITLRAYGPHLNGLTRRLRRRYDGLGGEVEGNAENVGIFHIEEPFLVQVVGLTTESSSDDLLAKELRAEGADAENVSDRVRIPTLGEHRHRNHAPDGAAELTGLTHGVHDLTQ